MRHLCLKSLAGSTLLLFAMTAGAQDRDHDRDEDRYHHGDRDEGWWHGHLFQRIRDDIQHVQSVTVSFSADQYRLTRVKEELNELQNKYEAHGYDQAEMDDVVNALARVVTDNHLSGRDRDMLDDDLNRLREFREHHEGYR